MSASPVKINIRKEYAIVIGLLLGIALVSHRVRAEDDVTIVTGEVEKIPVHHALASLEVDVKEVRGIETFCRKHFDIGRADCPSDEKTEVTDDERCDTRPFSCADLFNGGKNVSGVYTIYAEFPFSSTKYVQVYCDMKSLDGGWTVFQRRGPSNPHISFYRSWRSYARGFGDLKKEFWLGNDDLYLLTNQKDAVTLRIELEDFKGNFKYATYERFRIGAPEEDFKLDLEGYIGDAGSHLELHNGEKFVTYDRNDVKNCSINYRGGWWYGTKTFCHSSNLNGLYKYNQTSGYSGVIWGSSFGEMYSLKWAEMKFRPQSFNPKRKIKLCRN